MYKFGKNTSEAQETAFPAYGMISSIWGILVVLSVIIIFVCGEGDTIAGFIIPALLGLVFMNCVVAAVNLIRHGRLYRPKSEVDQNK